MVPNGGSLVSVHVSRDGLSEPSHRGLLVLLRVECHKCSNYIVYKEWPFVFTHGLNRLETFAQNVHAVGEGHSVLGHQQLQAVRGQQLAQVRI